MKWKYKNKRNSRNKNSAIGEIESEKMRSNENGKEKRSELYAWRR